MFFPLKPLIKVEIKLPFWLRCFVTELKLKEKEFWSLIRGTFLSHRYLIVKYWEFLRKNCWFLNRFFRTLEIRNERHFLFQFSQQFSLSSFSGPLIMAFAWTKNFLVGCLPSFKRPLIDIFVQTMNSQVEFVALFSRPLIATVVQTKSLLVGSVLLRDWLLKYFLEYLILIPFMWSKHRAYLFRQAYFFHEFANF